MSKIPLQGNGMAAIPKINAPLGWLNQSMAVLKVKCKEPWGQGRATGLEA